MKRSNYRLEQYMKKSRHHIARLLTFSIMEEIILSKGKCTNNSEAKPLDWQQAKGPFCAAFKKDRQDAFKQAPVVGFHYLKINCKRCCFFIGSSPALKTSRLLSFAPESTIRYLYSLCICSTDSMLLLWNHKISAKCAIRDGCVCFSDKLWGCGMCCPSLG